MAHRSDREQGHPAECPRRHSLLSRVGPSSRTPSRPAVTMSDRTNRPDRRPHPTNRQKHQRYSLQCGSHPQRTFQLEFRSVRRANDLPNFARSTAANSLKLFRSKPVNQKCEVDSFGEYRARERSFSRNRGRRGCQLSFKNPQFCGISASQIGPGECWGRGYWRRERSRDPTFSRLNSRPAAG